MWPFSSIEQAVIKQQLKHLEQRCNDIEHRYLEIERKLLQVTTNYNSLRGYVNRKVEKEAPLEEKTEGIIPWTP